MNAEFINHLVARGLKYWIPHQRYIKAYIDEEKELVSFPIYSRDGIFKGFQQYNWKGTKARNQEDSKYVTYCRNQTCWGWESIDPNKEIIFVTESIFKSLAIINQGYNSIALLGSTMPKQMSREFKNDVHYLFIWIGDPDVSGIKAKKYFNHAHISPQELDEMSEDQVRAFLQNIINNL